MGSVIHARTATLTDSFLATVAARGDAPVMVDADLEVVLSRRDYGARPCRAAAGLGELRLSHGDALGLLLRNRPEFHVADAGALLVGATPFSMYDTSAPEQLAHMITDAACRVVITETALVERLRTAPQQAPGVVEHVIIVESEQCSQPHGFMHVVAHETETL